MPAKDPVTYKALYNPGQYFSMQEKEFSSQGAAEKWVENWKKMNPNGEVKLFGFNGDLFCLDCRRHPDVCMGIHPPKPITY